MEITDLITKLTMNLGICMSNKELNEVYEALDEYLEESKDWKFDVVFQYVKNNKDDVNVLDKAVELSKDLGLTSKAKMYGEQEFWRMKLNSINIKEIGEDKPKKEKQKQGKKITYQASDYGCGGSSSYGCGSSSDYGCGYSSKRYGC